MGWLGLPYGERWVEEVVRLTVLVERGLEHTLKSRWTEEILPLAFVGPVSLEAEVWQVHPHGRQTSWEPQEN